MQRDLDALMDWRSTWGMKFNAKKCNIMRVSRSRKPLQHFYSLGNEILQEVSDAKYLGIQIDNKLEYNDLCDLYNVQQYTVHCLAVKLPCMHLTVRMQQCYSITWAKFGVSHKWLVQIQSTRAMALARAK